MYFKSRYDGEVAVRFVSEIPGFDNLVLVSDPAAEPRIVKRTYWDSLSLKPVKPLPEGWHPAGDRAGYEVGRSKGYVTALRVRNHSFTPGEVVIAVSLDSVWHTHGVKLADLREILDRLEEEAGE